MTWIWYKVQKLILDSHTRIYTSPQLLTIRVQLDHTEGEGGRMCVMYVCVHVCMCVVCVCVYVCMCEGEGVVM